MTDAMGQEDGADTQGGSTLVPKDELTEMEALSTDAMERRIGKLKKEMRKAAEELEFETAARLRDEVKKLEKLLMDLPN